MEKSLYKTRKGDPCLPCPGCHHMPVIEISRKSIQAIGEPELRYAVACHTPGCEVKHNRVRRTRPYAAIHSWNQWVTQHQAGSVGVDSMREALLATLKEAYTVQEMAKWYCASHNCTDCKAMFNDGRGCLFDSLAEMNSMTEEVLDRWRYEQQMKCSTRSSAWVSTSRST